MSIIELVTFPKVWFGVPKGLEHQVKNSVKLMLMDEGCHYKSRGKSWFFRAPFLQFPTLVTPGVNFDTYKHRHIFFFTGGVCSTVQRGIKSIGVTMSVIELVTPTKYWLAVDNHCKSIVLMVSGLQ